MGQPLVFLSKLTIMMLAQSLELSQGIWALPESAIHFVVTNHESCQLVLSPTAYQKDLYDAIARNCNVSYDALSATPVNVLGLDVS